MPRKGAVPKRKILPDPIYKSVLVAKFVNKLMRGGKKELAERIFYEAIKMVAAKTGRAPLEAFEEVLKNVMPVVVVRPRRVGGATYQVPVEVKPDRQVSLAIRWLVNFSRERAGKSMHEKLAAEILDALQNTGASVKMKEDTHRMAEANKAFAHYRW